jgi:hypothetical protein
LGRKALYAMVRRCNIMGISRVDMRLRLFDALVRPIMEFGCEVWGPWGFLTQKVAAQVEAIHLNFLKMCLGVKKTVATEVVYAELQRQPLADSWVVRALGYRDRVLLRTNGDLAKLALLGSIELARKDNGKN